MQRGKIIIQEAQIVYTESYVFYIDRWWAFLSYARFKRFLNFFKNFKLYVYAL